MSIQLEDTRTRERATRPSSDESLAAEARARAGARTDALFAEHHKLVEKICRGLLPERAEAEDAAQQTFLSAYCALLGGTEPRDSAAWVATIARNECVQRLTAGRRAPLATQDLDTLGHYADVHSQAVASLHAARLRREIRRLPAAQRDAIVLREFAGLSYDEVAGRLGVTRPAIHSLLVRARATLRARLSAAGAAINVAGLFSAIKRGLASVLGREAGSGLATSLVAKAAAVAIGGAVVVGGTMVAQHQLTKSSRGAALAVPPVTSTELRPAALPTTQLFAPLPRAGGGASSSSQPAGAGAAPTATGTAGGDAVASTAKVASNTVAPGTMRAAPDAVAPGVTGDTGSGRTDAAVVAQLPAYIPADPRPAADAPVLARAPFFPSATEGEPAGVAATGGIAAAGDEPAATGGSEQVVVPPPGQGATPPGRALGHAKAQGKAIRGTNTSNGQGLAKGAGKGGGKGLTKPHDPPDTAHGANPKGGTPGGNNNGNVGANTPNGNAGANVPNGNAGANTPNGNAGANVPNGNAGTNTPNGEAGANVPNGNAGANVPPGNAGTNTPTGNASTNTPSGNAGANVPNGNAGTNTPSGNAGTNTPNGNAGANTPSGNAGANPNASGGNGNAAGAATATTPAGGGQGNGQANATGQTNTNGQAKANGPAGAATVAPPVDPTA